MIYKWVREEIEKYSFITGSELKKGSIYFYYEKDGKKKFKRLPLRSDGNQVIKMVERIKKDIGYKEEKQKRDILIRKQLKEDEQKQMIFMFV